MYGDKRIFWVIALGFVVWYFSQKIQAAQALMIRLLLPQNIHFEKGALVLNLPIVITNPTGTPINLNRYNMQVLIEGYPVGTAYGTVFTSLLAGGDTTVLAKVVMPIDGLIGVVPSLMNAGRALDVRMQGRIVAEFINIPVNELVSIPIPKIAI